MCVSYFDDCFAHGTYKTYSSSWWSTVCIEWSWVLLLDFGGSWSNLRLFICAHSWDSWVCWIYACLGSVLWRNINITMVLSIALYNKTVRWTWFLQSYFFWWCFMEIYCLSINCSWLWSLDTIFQCKNSIFRIVEI